VVGLIETATTVGGTYVHACVSTGVPVQPEGDDERTVRVCVLFD
jgi:hypothetical protein